VESLVEGSNERVTPPPLAAFRRAAPTSFSFTIAKAQLPSLTLPVSQGGSMWMHVTLPAYFGSSASSACRLSPWTTKTAVNRAGRCVKTEARATKSESTPKSEPPHFHRKSALAEFAPPG